jgi:hypothetical protein
MKATTLPSPDSPPTKRSRLSPIQKLTPDESGHEKSLRSPLFLGSPSSSSNFFPSSPPPHHNCSLGKQPVDGQSNDGFGGFRDFNDPSMVLETSAHKFGGKLVRPTEAAEPVGSAGDDDVAAILDFLGDCVEYNE